MRILIINDFYPPEVLAGPEVICSYIDKHFREKGHKVLIATATLENRKSRDNIKYILKPYNHPYRKSKKNPISKKMFVDITTYLLSIKTLNKFMPDVVYVGNLRFTSFRSVLAVLNYGVPVVLHAHSKFLNKIKMNNDNSGIIGKIRSKLLYGSYSYSKIVCPSKYLMNEFIKSGFNYNLITNIPNGVDTALFKPSQNKKNPFIIEILYVGRISKAKGIHIAIDAIHDLKTKGFHSLVFRIIGQPEKAYKEDLLKLIQNKGLSQNVKIINGVKHKRLPEYYQKANLLILPSFSEIFPNVVLEAMSCGIPVIASCVGGIPEMIDDHKNGILVYMHDSKKYSKAIEELINNPTLSKNIGTNAREKVVKQYSNKQFMNNIEKVIINAAGK